MGKHGVSTVGRARISVSIKRSDTFAADNDPFPAYTSCSRDRLRKKKKCLYAYYMKTHAVARASWNSCKKFIKLLTKFKLTGEYKRTRPIYRFNIYPHKIYAWKLQIKCDTKKCCCSHEIALLLHDIRTRDLSFLVKRLRKTVIYFLILPGKKIK